MPLQILAYFFLTKRDLILESTKHSKNLNYSKQQVGVVDQACDPSTRIIKAGGLPWILGHPGLESETLCSSLRNVSHRLTYESTQSPVGVVFGEVVEGRDLPGRVVTGVHFESFTALRHPQLARSLSHGSGGRCALSVSRLSCLSLPSDVTVCIAVFTSAVPFYLTVFVGNLELEILTHFRGWQ